MVLAATASIPNTQRISLPTLGFGVCASLAIVIRWVLKLPFASVTNWRKTLNLTHTAVALGCIPALVVLALFPELLADRHDFLVEATSSGGPKMPGPRISLSEKILTIVSMATWIAVTEEIIFRGLLVSVARRWRAISTQKKRDLFAITLSALLFGLGHWATWGPAAAIALAGLGFGFATAYIVTGEKILPVIIYHTLFDTLSLTVSTL